MLLADDHHQPSGMLSMTTDLYRMTKMIRKTLPQCLSSSAKARTPIEFDIAGKVTKNTMFIIKRLEWVLLRNRFIKAEDALPVQLQP